MKLSLNFQGKDLEMKAKVASYDQGGNLAIRLYSKAEYGFAPFCMLTANTDAVCPENCSLININRGFEGIEDWVKEHGLAVPTRRSVRSGYCLYPEYQFKPEILRELDPAGYAAYLARREEDD